jgi:Flp pilus assembly protein TadD
MSSALERYRQMVAQHPGNELARFSLGKALFDSGDFAGAREQFEAALERRSDWMVVRILLGKSLLELKDPVAARVSFEKARQLAVEQHHEGPLAEIDRLLSELNGS